MHLFSLIINCLFILEYLNLNYSFKSQVNGADQNSGPSGCPINYHTEEAEEHYFTALGLAFRQFDFLKASSFITFNLAFNSTDALDFISYCCNYYHLVIFKNLVNYIGYFGTDSCAAGFPYLMNPSDVRHIRLLGCDFIRINLNPLGYSCRHNIDCSCQEEELPYLVGPFPCAQHFLHNLNPSYLGFHKVVEIRFVVVMACLNILVFLVSLLDHHTLPPFLVGCFPLVVLRIVELALLHHLHLSIYCCWR